MVTDWKPIIYYSGDFYNFFLVQIFFEKPSKKTLFWIESAKVELPIIEHIPITKHFHKIILIP
jgi:hypothetical protein